jgi:EpsI family protein
VIFVGLRFLESTPPAPAPPAAVKEAPATGGWHLRDVFGLATVFWTLAFVGVAPQAVEVGLARPLETLPLQLGSWTAVGAEDADSFPASASVLAAWSGADRKLERVYRAKSGQTARVEVFYFAVQRQGREIISSASADLHRQASLTHIDSGTSQQFSANAVQWPERKETGLFWYETAGRAETGQISTKLTTMWRALVLRRTNGAAIMLRTGNQPGALGDLQDLAKALRPALANLLTTDESR